jgi:hypothetical protein
MMRTRITIAVSMLAGALLGGAESMEALQRWRKSPEQAALKMGEKYAKFNIVAVNGVRQ